jgi:phosphopantetheinyl transferase (holo-ACP synthase)
MMAHSLEPGVSYFYSEPKNSHSMDFLHQRYLNFIEKKTYNDLNDEQKLIYLTGRIALKDAVRAYFRSKKSDATYCYPVEVHTEDDAHRNIRLKSLGNKNLDGVFVSLAQVGIHAVAVASDKPVGIEVLCIEEQDESILKKELTQREQSCLPEGDKQEWAARFLATKAACRKAFDNDAQLEITHVIGEEIMLGNVCVKTAKLGANHVVGWTT